MSGSLLHKKYVLGSTRLLDLPVPLLLGVSSSYFRHLLHLGHFSLKSLLSDRDSD